MGFLGREILFIVSDQFIQNFILRLIVLIQNHT